MTRPMGPHSTVQKVAETRMASEEMPVRVGKIQGSTIPETAASIRTNRPKVNSGRFQSSNTASDSRNGHTPAISTPTYGINLKTAAIPPQKGAYGTPIPYKPKPNNSPYPLFTED